MTNASRSLDELCHLTAQSLVSLETTEHFQIIKMLGEGSYGQVKLAVHKKRGTPMALKFFPRESTGLLSFLREYNLSLAFCSHPSLTSALGIAFSTPEHYVFAQQPSLYGDLFDVIVSEVGLGEDCSQRVASQLSGALSHLHRLGFVHRDLKPENVFLCDPQCRWVKLGDFGMAKARGIKVPCVWYSSAYCTPESEIVRETDEEVEVDGSGSEAGTMALDENGNPVEVVVEVRRPKKQEQVWVSVEPSTDTWALGMLIYAMLTGVQPWAETASDCRGYQLYKEWADHANEEMGNKNMMEDYDGQMIQEEGEEEEMDRDMNGNDNNNNNSSNVIASQFTFFTPLGCSLFLSLLHPDPELRGGAEEVMEHLGGSWLREEERRRREEEAAIRKQRELMEEDDETERVQSRDR
ncbi:serine/threonine-protein kinase SBK1 [Engraulis encrasicolus]|uniref:serine/threonine-protein kinase SBK1 n=1 Tax=Engraulis encrasicolus TaxID=184585 RepID=UPI002FD1DF31